MSGTVISINLSPRGGVPKLPVPRATITMEGIEGDYNWFRANNRDMAPGRAGSLFSQERAELTSWLKSSKS